MYVAEYADLDGWAIAELIQSGEVDAKEVHAVALDAIDRVQPQLNALAAEPFEGPLAFDPIGFFAGTPFGLKDLICHAEGVPTRMGSRVTGPSGVVFDSDTELMRRFRKAGLATTVLTTSPEMGYNANTEPVITGSTRNPWNPQHSAGGSSGGSSALVAAGALPIAHANDGGGSIRIPAAYNGLVGLKPTRGLVPSGPDMQELLYGFATEFAVTRSVRDAAALLDEVAGWAPGEKYRVQAPTRSYREELGASRTGLRIAVVTDSWAGTMVDPEVVGAVTEAAACLESLGHQIELASPQFSWDDFMLAHYRYWGGFVSESVHGTAALSGLEPGVDTLEATVLAGYLYGRELTVIEMGEAAGIVNGIARQIGEFFQRYDVILTPTTNTPALPLGYLNQDAALDHEEWTRRIFDVVSFTPLFNLTGSPAISLPLAQASSGLPIGLQLVGDHCSDGLLLDLATQLESAKPWRGRRPAIHASN